MKTFVIYIVYVSFFNFVFAGTDRELKPSETVKLHSDLHEDHSEHNSDETDHDDHTDSKSIDKDKAIQEVNERNGFKLSPQAIDTLKIKFKNIENNIFTISKESLVVSKYDRGIYRYRDGFFKFIDVQIIKKDKLNHLVKIEDFEKGDQVVISGVKLLKVSDVFSTDTAEYGHSH